MAYRVGDRVVIVRSRTVPEHIGTVTTILASEPASDWLAEGAPEVTPGENLYELDLPYPSGGNYWTIAACIRPYRDDGSEKGEWTDELRKLCGGRVTA